MNKRYKGDRPKAVVEEISADSKIKTVELIQSLIDAHVIYTGRESGKQYIWSGAGAIVEVDVEDVPELLSKTRGKKPCCGNQETKIFQLAQ